MAGSSEHGNELFCFIKMLGISCPAEQLSGSWEGSCSISTAYMVHTLFLTVAHKQALNFALYLFDSPYFQTLISAGWCSEQVWQWNSYNNTKWVVPSCQVWCSTLDTAFDTVRRQCSIVKHQFQWKVNGRITLGKRNFNFWRKMRFSLIFRDRISILDNF